MGIDLRPVDRFMTARAPAGSTVQKRRVIEIPDIDCARRGLLLEMAAQA